MSSRFQFSQWVLLFFLLSLTSCEPNQAQESYDVLITDVNIVDVVNGNVLRNQHLAINGDSIALISDTRISANSKKQIQGKGKYLIPGLWDMHAHPDDPEVWRMKPKTEEKDRLMPLFVVNGVTGIRDMGGDIQLIKRWRQLYHDKELLAPKIFAGGPLLDGPNPMWDGSVGINGPDQAKHVVDSLINEGVDFLKIYSLLPRETYLAVSQYANEIGFPFVGHVPFTVPPSEAAKTGMKSQEHLLEILKECSDTPSEAFMDSVRTIQNRVDRSNALNNFRVESFDAEKAQALYRTFEKYNIWHCPTLSMWHKNAWFEQEAEKDKELTSYLPPYLKAYWTPQHNDHLQYRDNQEYINTKQKLYALYVNMVREMNKLGVLLLAGTDVGANPLCHPGIGIHNELQALTEAGLTPLESLQTATLNPAIFFGISDNYGSVAIGKVADLVLLDENPLDDISHIRKINMVIRDGRVIDSVEISRIKNEIKKANASPWKG